MECICKAKIAVVTGATGTIEHTLVGRLLGAGCQVPVIEETINERDAK